ncbi:hypothetical protein [Streptomyces sp. H27-S2]|uniref:hypothetical protein n=1 Tax=Streptomyces antarcticus TaxID=2996458 RepID=UPI002271C273|nr:hypothetical protein [Streptomyces sp. H27-S2]MCY0950671.1 hypothetical protein [Streptomyces sp. H27-S2]
MARRDRMPELDATRPLGSLSQGRGTLLIGLPYRAGTPSGRLRSLDTDCSGKLSVDELLAAMRHSYTSPGVDAAGNWLYGPIA